VARSRDKNPDESLRGTNRQLRSENKQLKRQVARLQKQLARQPIESIEEEEDDLELPDSSNSSESLTSCPICHKPLVAIDMGIKTVYSCKACKYRSALKD